MGPTPFSAKPTLHGELVTLRPILAEDADTIDAIIRADDEIARLTGSVHSSTAATQGYPSSGCGRSTGHGPSHRIALEVYDFNPRARHVYEKVGFVHEGTGRQALCFDDGWIDVHYMAILATDPPPRSHHAGSGLCGH